MIATLQPTPLDMWRRRLGGRKHRMDHPHRAAALGYMAHGPVENGLIEVGELTLVILYACQVRPWQRALRLAGFSGKPVPWGVRWGGPDNAGSSRMSCFSRFLAGQDCGWTWPSPELLTLAPEAPRRTASCRALWSGTRADSTAQTLGSVRPGNRGQHHGRRPGTGGLCRANRPITSRPAETTAARSFRPNPLSLGVDQPRLG